jgi:hypothetical protein
MGFSRAPEDRPTPPEIYNYRIYVLTFLSCLGSWMFGYNNGVRPTLVFANIQKPTFELSSQLGSFLLKYG